MLTKLDQFEISRICDKSPEKIVEFTTSLLSALGTVNKQEFSEVMQMSLRTVERKCKSNEIPNIFGMPLINVYMKGLKNE